MPKCNEDGCEVLKTGICINRFADIQTCPHYSVEGDDHESKNDGNPKLDTELQEESDTVDDHLKMHTGLSLLEEEVNSISKDNYTNLIILAGMPDAGKTTALLSLVHQFETQQSYHDFLFAGSKTLVDFEEKAWPSKIDSRKESADTFRTNDMVPKFVHLKLAHKSSIEKKQDILFTDVSGELFRTLKDSTPESKKFILAKRADHFALFFDAHALSDAGLRFSAKTSGLGILRSLTEAGVLEPKTRIQIVFSRWDLLEAKANKEQFLPFIDAIQTEVAKWYESSYQLSFHRIASRPSKSSLPFAYGIDELFDLWVTRSQLDFNVASSAEEVSADNDTREFSKYSFTK